MEEIASAHGGGPVKRTRWTDIDPLKYDDPDEVPGLSLDAGSFVSPYDVPDGIRLRPTGDRGYHIELRYLADQEKVEREETDLPEIQFGFGQNSSRLVSLEVTTTKEFPSWEKIEHVLSGLTDQEKRINHFIVRSVLRDAWSQLAQQVRNLKPG